VARPGSGGQPQVAKRRVARHHGGQAHLDAAGDGRPGKVDQRRLKGGEPVGKSEASGSFVAHRIVEADLRSVEGQREARLASKRNGARPLSRIRVVERTGLEQEFVDRQALVIERELPVEPIARRRIRRLERRFSSRVVFRAQLEKT
jgi:hypothetical protein